MLQADIFVAVGNLQFGKHDGWQQRNLLPNGQGNLWLTVPVEGNMHTKLKDVKICHHRDWQQKHLRTLYLRYPKAAHTPLMKSLVKIYSHKWERLFDLNIALIKVIAAALEVRTPLIIDEEITGQRHDLIINLCQKYQALHHLAGRGSLNYMDADYLNRLRARGITTTFLPQDITSRFPYSAIHYLLSRGVKWTRRVLRA